MNLAELRDFVRVIRAGSFAAAAETSGVPRSTLSKRIQMLEASLELRLIERSTRKLRLTSDGELLLGRASRLIAEADDLERLMRTRNDKPQGLLRVSVPVMLGQELMGQVAAAYTRRWPKTRIEVVLTDSRSDLIEEGFDCAIRIGPLTDSDLVTKRLAWSRTILVASPRIVAGRALPESPHELRDWPTISFAPQGRPVDWNLERDGQKLHLHLQSAVMLGSLHAVREAALADGGVALVPAWNVRNAIADGGLVQLLADWRGPRSGIHLVYPSQRHPSARLRAFIEILESSFRETAIETAGTAIPAGPG